MMALQEDCKDKIYFGKRHSITADQWYWKCNKLQKPFVAVMKCEKYAHIDADMITTCRRLNEYGFIQALAVIYSYGCGKNDIGGNVTVAFDTLPEYAEEAALKIYNLMDDAAQCIVYEHEWNDALADELHKNFIRWLKSTVPKSYWRLTYKGIPLVKQGYLVTGEGILLLNTKGANKNV